MLRITEDVAAGETNAVLKLEGQIAGQWVSELRRVYLAVHRVPRPTIFDLEGVTFIDGAGLAFLEEIYPDVVFINCSLFAAEQLKVVTGRREAMRR